MGGPATVSPPQNNEKDFRGGGPGRGRVAAGSPKMRALEHLTFGKGTQGSVGGGGHLTVVPLGDQERKKFDRDERKSMENNTGTNCSKVAAGKKKNE